MSQAYTYQPGVLWYSEPRKHSSFGSQIDKSEKTDRYEGPVGHKKLANRKLE